MLALKLDVNDTFQARFHRRWQHLDNPHVRTLAWLIDAPDLLDPQAPQWQGKIASLGPDAGDAARGWLEQLERDPVVLHAYLERHPSKRLGRYAENLMAFYLQHQGVLQAHGVQVQANKNDTIGEFDFLIKRGDDLLHWEFATKLYLLESSGRGLATDYFVGPNLADTLGAKINKIFDRQLALASHPAAQAYLPQPVLLAQALVKGWLFYHESESSDAAPIGVSRDHCRGFWCPVSRLDEDCSHRYAILPRLSWLPPLKIDESDTLSGSQLKENLDAYFKQDRMPVLIVKLEPHGRYLLESERGFIVPDDWQDRAEQWLNETAQTALHA